MTTTTNDDEDVDANNLQRKMRSMDRFPILPPHDCLILTDSTVQALGGLPLYYQQMLEQQGGHHNIPPIYATFPTVKMGQMTLYDQHAQICLDGGKPPCTLEDIDNVFALVISIKYSQAITVPHPKTGQPSLSITAQRAGHVVGGAFYVLQRLQDETIVVFTSTYHIAKELHLDYSTLLKYGSSPDVLVTRPGGPAFGKLRRLAHDSGPGGRAALPPVLVTQAERNLVDTVLSVLRRDGNVLLPVDTSGRVLELVLLLDRLWERQRLASAYNLCWLGPMVTNTIDFARSQLEWMASALGHQFDSQQGHPYQLKSVRLCSTLRELEEVMADSKNQNPTCVLASGLSLEGGPARDVLLKWADNPDHAIVFTDSSQCYLRRKRRSAAHHRQSRQQSTVEERTQHPGGEGGPDASMDVEPEDLNTAPPTLEKEPTLITEEGLENDVEVDGGDGTLTSTGLVTQATVESEWTTAAQLLSAWFQAKYEGREMEDSIMVDIKVPHRAPLAGAELKSFLASEEEARKKQKEHEEKMAMLREVEIAKGQLRLGEQEGASNATTTTTAASNVATETAGASSKANASSSAPARPRKKTRFDATLFLKFSKPQHCKSVH